MRFPGRKFKVADIFQQMLGGVLLAGPFVVEGGVWDMAKTMNSYQAGFLALLTLAIGYSALYKADKDREIGEEAGILGVPYRFLSLVGVSFGAVVVLVLVLSGPETNGANLVETVRLVSIASVFSVIGAATADSLF